MIKVLCPGLNLVKVKLNVLCLILSQFVSLYFAYLVPQIRFEIKERTDDYDGGMTVYNKRPAEYNRPQQQSYNNGGIHDLFTPFLLALIPLALVLGAAASFGLASIIGKGSNPVAIAQQQQQQQESNNNNNNNNLIDLIITILSGGYCGGCSTCCSYCKTTTTTTTTTTTPASTTGLGKRNIWRNRRKRR